ncbi:MAG TPA: TlpA disulfide reductase family protein [Candidatus Polarisedimenticolia bacterium]|nr:TlpA disulfide reductase family protein [Candidatus Polarisedimenticolia bacterium]
MSLPRGMARASLCGAALAVILAAAPHGTGSWPSAAAAAPSLAASADAYLKPRLEDPQGRTIRLSDFRGKVRVFDVWASWCGPCRMGIPELNALYEHYREKGVVVVGISLDDTPADVARFVEEVPIHYPNGMMNPDLAALLGIGNEAMAIPITYVVDRTGKLRAKFVGFVGAGRIERVIVGLL